MRLNEGVQNSLIGRLFQLDERKSSFTTEINAGCTTFLSMAYILAVNPRILADSGGPCVVPEGEQSFLQNTNNVSLKFSNSTLQPLHWLP